MKNIFIIVSLILFTVSSTYAQPKKQLRHHKHHKHILKRPAQRKKAKEIKMTNKQERKKNKTQM
jgi:hypothetical protein